jgi:ELP3 family radical SAM enzyme/protein acetyltransferase
MSTLTEIEDIIKPFWFGNVSSDDIQKCYSFIDEYYFNKKPLKNIKNDFVIFQRDNKFSDLLKFGILITIYKLGRNNGKYPNSNHDLESAIKVNNVRENSGVMVFSIFTSAYPSYTKVLDDGSKEIVKDFSDNQENIKNSTNPGAFSCKYDCAYCPNEPGQPRSYLVQEPGVARASQCDYDALKQVFNRATQYVQQGHPVDKIEVIIQGGTWDSYSINYRTEFVRDIYYAFNIFMDWLFYNPASDIFKNNPDMFIHEGRVMRPKKSLEEEIIINETAPCRVIGLTPETRPDQINYATIRFLRKIGATKVQLGVQHLDDEILKYIGRGCYKKHTIRAIKMLKDCGIKVAVHLMLDLPAPDIYKDIMPEVDRKMLEEFNTSSDFKVDELKIYPCVVTEHTKIKTWYDLGIYQPYGEVVKIDPKTYKRMSKEDKLTFRMNNPLYKNIFDFYSVIHPSIRVMRIIRDIPTNIICGGTTQNGMRSEIDNDLLMLGKTSGCIRYREAGSYKHINKLKNVVPILKELVFESSGGTEYFLSWETDSDSPILFSFLRLRLSKNAGMTETGKVIFPELLDTALIRELHTYGKVQPCKENIKYYKDNNILLNESDEFKTQHKGYGKKLLKRAEEIAYKNGYKRIAVIAGVGVREYYRHNGYKEDSELGCYQIKHLNKPKIEIYYKISIIMALLAILIYNFL